jgi:phosphoglycolate phosphatase-like HAD superfamily hydrolase
MAVSEIIEYEKNSAVASAKAGLLDLDGTIINPVFRLHVLKALFKDLKEEYSGKEAENLFENLEGIAQKKIDNLGDQILRKNPRELIKEMLSEACPERKRQEVPGLGDFEKANTEIKAKLKAANKEKKYDYIKTDTEYSPLMPGAEEVIKLLKDNGFSLGIVTNQDQHIAEGQIKAHKLDSYFGAIVGNDSRDKDENGNFRRPNKPAPGKVYVVLEKLKVSKDAIILFFGDTENDSLLSPDRGENRPCPEGLEVKMQERGNGIEGYNNFKVLLVNQQVPDKVRESLTTSEKIDLETAEKQSGWIGERFGWIPNFNSLITELNKSSNIPQNQRTGA